MPKEEVDGVEFCDDRRFDFRIKASKVRERDLARIFGERALEVGVKIELKSESWQWERTGNICIEFEQKGEPSGLATTEADFWIHELWRNGVCLVRLHFDVPRLKELCREAFRQGRIFRNGGEGGRFAGVLLSLADIIQ